MAQREILQLGHPGLRTVCREVTAFGDAVQPLMGDLRDTLAGFTRAHGFGRGIAAPQIGSAERVIVIAVEKPQALINPAIVRRSRKRMTLWDDCFSFPDLLVKVTRHLAIDVRFQEADGTHRTLHADGALSELLQHEIDHLDGILAIDRAIDTRHIVFRSEYEKWLKEERPVAL